MAYQNIPAGSTFGLTRPMLRAMLTELYAADIAGSSLDLSGTLDVTGATTLDSTLAVVGEMTTTAGIDIGTTLDVTGATTLDSTLDVVGEMTTTAGLDIGTTLDVTGATTLDTTLDVAGLATLAGAATVGTTLGVTGVATAATLKASTATVLQDSTGDILIASGTTVPADTTTGYAKGCLFIDTDVATGTTGLYCNKGTNTSCVFTAVTQA